MQGSVPGCQDLAYVDCWSSSVFSSLRYHGRILIAVSQTVPIKIQPKSTLHTCTLQLLVESCWQLTASTVSSGYPNSEASNAGKQNLVLSATVKTLSSWQTVFPLQSLFRMKVGLVAISKSFESSSSSIQDTHNHYNVTLLRTACMLTVRTNGRL